MSAARARRARRKAKLLKAGYLPIRLWVLCDRVVPALAEEGFCDDFETDQDAITEAVAGTIEGVTIKHCGRSESGMRDVVTGVSEVACEDAFRNVIAADCASGESDEEKD